MNPDRKRGREVMQAIREVLMRDWDPIGVASHPEAADEYDSYIASVYRILVDTRSEDELVDFLFRMETETMGLSPRSSDHLRDVARKLLLLNVSK